MTVDSTGWTGEGTFTAILLEALKGIVAIERIRVEDAPASRADAGYAFISNEVYVTFRRREPVSPRFPLRLLWRKADDIPIVTLEALAGQLARIEGLGEPDYSDQGLLQYLRTERMVPPYQTKGIKVVELVRLYEIGTLPRR